MENKLRPTVLITTYSSNTYSYMHSIENQTQIDEATKAENSTDLFNRFRRSLAENKIIINLSQIKGPTGSVRGHRDVVRKSLEGIKVVAARSNRRLYDGTNLSTFVSRPPVSLSNSHHTNSDSSKGSSIQLMNELYCSEILEKLYEEEQNYCVAYTTSLGVIRRTFEDSKAMRTILNLNLIRFEERDIYLNQEYKHQLRIRTDSFIVPALFVDGSYFGGIKELEAMNENGDLTRLLTKFKMPKAQVDTCRCCGNAKFIACSSCNGSRKSTIHHFKFNSIALRCIKCDQNDGLVPCPLCSASRSQKESQLLTEINNNQQDVGC